MTKEARRKADHAWRLKNGLCTACGKRKAREGRNTCQECSDRYKAKYRAMQPDKKKALIARTVERNRQRIEQAKAAGVCYRCGEPLYKWGLCQYHYEDTQARLRKKEIEKLHRGDDHGQK